MDMDTVLIRRNQAARNTGVQDLSLCEVWNRGDFLHTCFSSVGCRFREAGYCTMCDYGGGRAVTAKEAVSQLKKALEEAAGPVREILLGTCGSILDEREMALPVLDAILETVRGNGIPTVIFETHYTTVTPQILSRIQKALPDQEVVLELGFESADPWVLKHSLCKYMNLDDLAGTVSLIQSFDMAAVLNVFLGAPFLTTEGQIRDAINSIAWAVTNGANRVVVFPANIKPNTLLWQMYQEGSYCRISHWMLIELLNRLDDRLLEKVELAWYGDRQAVGRAMAVIPPKSCPVCQQKLMDFYDAFLRDFDPQHRRQLLAELCEEADCSCRASFLRELGASRGDCER